MKFIPHVESHTSRNSQEIQIDQNDNRTSKHNNAITEMNFEMYKYLVNTNANEGRLIFYAEQWIKFEKLTNIKLNEEHNVKINNKWKDNIKSNPKRLWEMIDWNDAKKETEAPRIDSNVVQNYFTNIFQNKHTINNPVVEDIMNVVNSYNCYIPLLDDPFSIDEFNTAINEIGKGTGMDGLEPKVARLFPMTLRLELLSRT